MIGYVHTETASTDYTELKLSPHTDALFLESLYADRFRLTVYADVWPVYMHMHSVCECMCVCVELQ